MRIISKFKEPYDHIAGYSDDLTWIRLPKVEEYDQKLLSKNIGSTFNMLGLNKNNGLSEYKGYFILAGKGYPFVCLVKDYIGGDKPPSDVQRALHLEGTEYTFMFSANDLQRTVRELQLQGLSSGTLPYFTHMDWTVRDLYLDTPIALIMGNYYRAHIYTDMVFSVLHKHNLWSFFGIHSVFNDIYKYLANKAVNTELPQVANDVRIQQHGFDLKTSFRKAKGNK